MSPDPGIKADLHRYHKLSPTFPNEKGGCTGPPKKGSIIETCTPFKTPVAKKGMGYISRVSIPPVPYRYRTGWVIGIKSPTKQRHPMKSWLMNNTCQMDTKQTASKPMRTHLSKLKFPMKTTTPGQINKSEPSVQTHKKGLYDRDRMFKRNQTIEKISFPEKRDPT